MKSILRASILAAALAAGTAAADEASVKGAFSERFPKAKVESVAKAPMGLYEVYADGRIWYVDEQVNHFILGSISDARTHRNLTAERMQKLTAVPFERLPLDLAIKIVKGSGKRKLAIFEDPDCPYCRQLERELVKVSDVTVYVFLLPIEQLHKGATEKSRKIWCAQDRAQAWLDAVLKDVVPEGGASCETPVDKLAELGTTFRISGTPTMFFTDGNRMAGATSAANLERLLDAAAKAEASTPKQGG